MMRKKKTRHNQGMSENDGNNVFFSFFYIDKLCVITIELLCSDTFYSYPLPVGQTSECLAHLSRFLHKLPATEFACGFSSLTLGLLHPVNTELLSMHTRAHR